jgi:hypothetical protein
MLIPVATSQNHQPVENSLHAEKKRDQSKPSQTTPYLLIAQFAESNVAVDSSQHEEDQHTIQHD